jgi:hypothetical protein
LEKRAVNSSRAAAAAPRPWIAATTSPARLIREVLLAVLPFAAGPADAWPADDRWPDILPARFVRRCAPETPVHQDAGAWTAWWRGLTGQRRDTGIKTADAAAELQLTDWLTYFSPCAAADSRNWRWWKGGSRGRSTGWIRFSIDEHPYRGRRALLWLIEAAGGHDIDLA